LKPTATVTQPLRGIEHETPANKTDTQEFPRHRMNFPAVYSLARNSLALKTAGRDCREFRSDG
jgi:hypothetical protein